MKREMGLKKTPEDEDHYDSPVDSDAESPVDLRTTCVIERETKSKGNQSKSEHKNQNIVLTSLLQRNVVGTALSSQKENVKSCSNTPSKSLWYDNSTNHTALRVNYKYDGYAKNDYVRFGQSDSLLSVKLKQTSHQCSSNRRDIERSYPLSPKAYIQQPNEFNGTKDMPSAFRRVSKHEFIGKSLNSNTEKESKESVPNYRKFYSRCSNLSQTPKTKIKLVTTVQSQNSLRHRDDDHAYNYDHLSLMNRLSGSSHDLQDQSLRAALDSSVCSRSGYFRKHSRLYEHNGQRRLEDTVQCLKRKLAYPTRDLTNEASKKDSTLRCLLETSMSETSAHSKHSDKFMNSAFDKGRNENDCEEEFENVRENHMWRNAQMSRRKGYCSEGHEHSLNLAHEYYSQILQNANRQTENGVLRSLLIADPKVPSQILPVQAPPISGSPGSESTSSGSTDSGVYSDNPVEDPNLIRRRVSRALTGKHVKSGTGASLSTLRILRQMIEKRRQKNDRKH